MYQIGQICIGQNFITDTYRNGMECVIVGGLEKRSWRNRAGEEGESFGYRVRWEREERIYHQEPPFLRPKHEPGSWDELEKMIGWRPKEKILEVWRESDCVWTTKENSND